MHNTGSYPLPTMLSCADVAAELGITEPQARQLFNRRAFALVKIGRRLYVSRDTLTTWLDAQTIPARA